MQLSPAVSRIMKLSVKLSANQNRLLTSITIDPAGIGFKLDQVTSSKYVELTSYEARELLQTEGDPPRLTPMIGGRKLIGNFSGSGFRISFAKQYFQSRMWNAGDSPC